MKSTFKAQFFGILLGLLLFPIAVQSAEPKPVLTLSVSSYKDIIDGSKKIADLIGFADEFEEFESAFGKLSGTDNTKPLGFVLFTDEEQFFPVAFLPIGDLDKLKAQFPDLDELISDNLQSVSKGKYQFSGTDYVIEQKKDWLVLYQESQKSVIPLDPTTLLGGLNKKQHFALRVDFENTPEELVLQAIAPLEFIMSMTNPEAGEQIATLKEQLHVLLTQGKWWTFGFSIDPKNGNMTGEAVSAWKPDSSFGKAMSAFSTGKTNRIGFYQPDHAFAAIGYGLIPDDQKETNIHTAEQYISAFQEGLEEELDDEDLELATELVETIQKIIVATIQEGKIDFASSFLSSGEIIFSTQIAKGENLSGILKKSATKIGEIEPSLKDLMKLEYTTFEGFRFSRIAIPLNMLPQADEMPGPLQEKTIYVLLGIKSDGICGVVGTEESRLEPVLKKGITDSKKEANVPKRLGQFSLPLTAKAIKATGLAPKEPEIDALFNTLEKAPKTAVAYMDMAVTTNSQAVTVQEKYFCDGTMFSAIAKAVRAAEKAQEQAALEFNPFEKGKKTSKTQSDTNNVRDFEF